MILIYITVDLMTGNGHAGPARGEHEDRRGGRSDSYAATAEAYDFHIAAQRQGQIAALEELRPRLSTEFGPILDIGAGSGLNSAWVLEHAPGAEVVALEPSPAMRSLALGRIAAHPEWCDRITIRPEDFFSATLPSTIGGAILLGVLGHFDPGERAAVLAELAARLPRGGAALIDLPEPETPARMEPVEFTSAQVGQLTYRTIAEAWSEGDELLRWRITYLTLDGERVLTEETAEHLYHHPSERTVMEEARQVGLRSTRIADSTHRLFIKG